MTLALLAEHALDDVVCFRGSDTWTRADLEALAVALRAALPSAPPGARLVIACRDRFFFMAALLVASAERWLAVLPHAHVQQALAELSALPGTCALVHDGALLAPGSMRLDGGAWLDLRAVIPVGGGRLALSGAAELGPRARGHASTDAPSVRVYTSGSTGTPTAHDKSYAQLAWEAADHLDTFQLRRRALVCSVSPQHVYGLLFGVFVPLLGGGSVTRHSPSFPADIAQALGTSGARVMVSVPAQLVAFADSLASVAGVGRRLRVFSSAAPLPEAVRVGLEGHGAEVIEVFGSTETGGIATRQALAAPFRPLPSVSVTTDSEGRLLLRSRYLPSAWAQPFVGTDRITLLDDGFALLGRTDRVVKLAGVRVDLGDVEAALRALPGVSEARVLCTLRPERGRGAELWAVVVQSLPQLSALAPPQECFDAGPAPLPEPAGGALPAQPSAGATRASARTQRDALLSALRVSLPAVAVPRRVRFVTSLPQSARGKVEESALRALFQPFGFETQQTATGVRVWLPNDAPFFDGHFPEQPVLAGVVALKYIVLMETRRLHPDLSMLTRLTRVKFRRPVRPGEALDLTLRRHGLDVSFEIRVASEPAASGTLHFRGDVE